MSALFACTKCHKRYPFEDLSSAEQLCKTCRNPISVIKCTYCRTEFQHGEKGSTNALCKRCAQNVKTYGKPSACQYCSVIAAFIGKLCQRCVNSEKKWGPPQSCDQCKQKCAFLRKDEDNKKKDSKLLCWLCTMSYKRALAKARSLQGSTGSGSRQGTPNNNDLHKDKNVDTPPPTNDASKSNSIFLSQEPESILVSNEPLKSDLSKNTVIEKQFTHNKRTESNLLTHKSAELTSPSKKQRLEKSSNGFTTSLPKTSTTSENSFLDLAVTDNMILITQLKEEVESLRKQLHKKDLTLLEKERQLTDLKAENYEAIKTHREKNQALQKRHNELVEELQEKNRSLTKQVSTLSKLSKKDKPTILSNSNS